MFPIRLYNDLPHLGDPGGLGVEHEADVELSLGARQGHRRRRDLLPGDLDAEVASTLVEQDLHGINVGLQTNLRPCRTFDLGVMVDHGVMAVDFYARPLYSTICSNIQIFLNSDSSRP